MSVLAWVLWCYAATSCFGLFLLLPPVNAVKDHPHTGILSSIPAMVIECCILIGRFVSNKERIMSNPSLIAMWWFTEQQRHLLRQMDEILQGYIDIFTMELQVAMLLYNQQNKKYSMDDLIDSLMPRIMSSVSDISLKYMDCFNLQRTTTSLEEIVMHKCITIRKELEAVRV